MKLIITSSRRDGILIQHVSGEVDVYTAGQLRSSVESQIASGESAIIIDLREVTFLDSTGLGVLVGRLRKLRQGGGWLRVVCTDERIVRLFGITGLDQVLPIDASVEDAVAAGPAPAEPVPTSQPHPRLGSVTPTSTPSSRGPKGSSR